MSLSLPADPPRARSLTGVVPQMMAALDGRSDWFAPASSAIVFVVDGLGAHNLASRSGHARFLSQAGSKSDVARTVFPSTTASALTSLLTGVMPGEHGIVGYRALVPEADEVVNQLRGWDTDGLPQEWQRATPLTTGRPSFVVSKSRVRRHGLHRSDDAGRRVPSPQTTSSNASNSPRTSPPGIRDRSSTSTRRTSTRSATSAAGSPMSG